MMKMTTNNDAICYIMQMTRADFYRKILKVVASSKEFSCLVTLGVDAISAEDKAKICHELAVVGVPICYSIDPSSDDLLEEIACTITARAVSIS